MKTRSDWVKNGRVVGVAGVVCALAFFVVIRDRGANAGTDGTRAEFVPASGASGLLQLRKAQQGPEVYGRLPISFEKNVGQSAREVSYLSRGSGFELFLTSEEAVLALQNPVPRDLSPRHRFATLRALHQARLARKVATTTALRMRFEGSNPKAQIAGLDVMPGRVNYFIGNDPKKWRTDVRTFSRVKYAGLYPGVDLIFYGNGRRLEYDFVVSPGADPDAIRLNLQGARKARINNAGDVVLSVGRGEVLIQKPLIYQVIDGKRREIAGNFVLSGVHELAFQVPHYDRSEPLILDPVLNYSTYLGGSSDDQGAAIAVDANGNVIVAGTSFSTDFPTSSNAFMPQPLAANVNGASAAFVSEIDATGTQLKYSTYLAGSTPFDFAFGVSVDPTGKIYVTGTTVSTDFPTSSTNPNFKAGFKVGTNSTNLNGTSFIVKLDPAATTGQNSLLYSSYIGGTNGTQFIGDIGQSIAVDANGVAYVTGYTDSSPGTSVTDLTGFPVVGGFQTTLGSANGNGFLAKIDTTQSGAASLLYSTYFGGNAVNFNSATDFIADVGNGVVIDSNSNAYMTGVTYSTDLAVAANAVQTAYPTGNSTNTAFLGRVNTTQTGSASLAYLSYLGGTGPDFGDAIALGPNNVAYLTGQTRSLNFPTTTGAYSTSGNASGQAYVTLVNTNAAVGAPPAYSTFLGGTGGDDGFGIRVDATGNAYVAGGTSSSDFPITFGAFQPALATNAAGDGFVFKLNPGGNGNADLLYSTYFGGSGSSVIDQIGGIAIDASNNVYVTGVTGSSTTFPVFPNPGAFQTTLHGTSDAFVAKLTPIPTLAVVPTSLNFGTQPVGVASPPQTVTVTNNNSATVTFSSIAISGVNSADFSKATDTCSPSVAAGAQCTVSVTFTPSAPATLNEVATLAFTDSDVNSPQNVSLTGSGSASAPGAGLAPATLAFGNQLVNTTSAAQTVTLTNTGTAALTITSIAASGDFAETSTGATACPISPATLPATAGSNTCTISVTFTPTVAGPRTGTLTVSDNAGGGTQTVSLTGNGTSPPPDFTLSAAPTTVTVAQGAVSTAVTITVNPTNGFNSAVALTCAGAPANSACALSPASITPPTTSALTFTAHALLVPLPMSKPAPPLHLLRIVPLFFVLMLLFLLRSTQRFRTRLAMVSAIIVCVTLAACGGSSYPNNNTAKGTYPLTITGTSGALTHNATVTVTVN
jgi:Beta-propeller repeat